jgi:hypothetical protein
MSLAASTRVRAKRVPGINATRRQISMRRADRDETASFRS